MQTLTVRPYQLMCLFCRLGRKDRSKAYFHETRLDEIQSAIEQNPIVPISLCCNTDTAYQYQNPGRAFDTPVGDDYNDLRDLAVLRKLGAVPGETRPAVDFFDQIPAAIPVCAGICAYPAEEAPGWPACCFAATGNYERGLAQGVGALIHRQSPAEKQAAKKASCDQCYGAKRLKIRPHHLLCMTCFHKGKPHDELSPIQEDNLFECIDIMQKNPDIPVKLIAGPCMICPPCSAYHPASNLCIGGRSMALRDQKKDLDTLRRLGLRYGDVLPARELLRRLYASVRSTKEVCGCGDGIIRSPEWDGCGREGLEVYVKGRAAGLGIPGLVVEDAVESSASARQGEAVSVNSERQLAIPPMSARAFFVAKGERLRIIDEKGGQPGDLVAFNAQDLAERFSQSRTRVENRASRITQGHTLWTNAVPPRIMLTILANTSGHHDLLYTPCNRYALEKRFGVSRDGCQEHLADSLAPWGIKLRDIPDPLSLFFNVVTNATGALSIGDHQSKPGDFIEMRAEMDCLVAVSTCSVPIHGRTNSGFAIYIASPGKKP